MLFVSTTTRPNMCLCLLWLCSLLLASFFFILIIAMYFIHRLCICRILTHSYSPVHAYNFVCFLDSTLFFSTKKSMETSKSHGLRKRKKKYSCVKRIKVDTLQLRLWIYFLERIFSFLTLSSVFFWAFFFIPSYVNVWLLYIVLLLVLWTLLMDLLIPNEN